MRHVTDQIQELLEGMENIRLQQNELLACTESRELDALPPPDYETYQRLQREREAKVHIPHQIDPPNIFKLTQEIF